MSRRVPAWSLAAVALVAAGAGFVAGRRTAPEATTHTVRFEWPGSDRAGKAPTGPPPWLAEDDPTPPEPTDDPAAPWLAGEKPEPKPTPAP